jgi:endonuclease YncB( thermonuclease family)
MKRLLAALWLGLAVAASPAAAEPRIEDGAVIEGVAAVIDGDTFQVGAVRVRLFGIDAPESGQAGGDRATAALAGLAEGRPVRCEVLDVDRYGRLVATCLAWPRRRGAAVDLGQELVRHGWALDYPRYSAGRYAAEQALAARAGAGMWRSGPPEPPWQWRARQRP